MADVLKLINEAVARKKTQGVENQLRVAAYCRVSTDFEEQKTSYRTQKAFYTEFIQNHPGWIFAGIYADEGITGTSRLHRDEFNQMMQDAKDGKIDLIVTKSISRFARNTVDTLDCVRQLKLLSPSVGVFFEKENINTLDSTSEVILTIYSALAQEESQSISDNIHWAYQKRFQEGKPQVNLNRMIGYDAGENGEWIINEEQAEPVRYLFKRYACGAGRETIIREMNERGWKTATGAEWNSRSLNNVLVNEKFVGDLEMQKYVTSNFLTHKAVVNRGQLPKYYIKNHHTPIIDRATWLIVQRERQREKPLSSRDPSVACYINLVCEKCGQLLSHKRRKLIAYWLDAAQYKDVESGRVANPLYGVGKMCCPGKGCTEELYELAIEQSFMEMLYRIKRDYEKNGERSELAVKYQACQKKPEDHTERIREIHELLQRLDKESKRLLARQLEVQKKQAEELRISLQDEWQKEISEGNIGLGDIVEDIDQRRVSEIYEPEQESSESLYHHLLEDVLKRKEELEKELHVLEGSSEGGMILKKQYELFMEVLLALPETNSVGQKMVVHGLDDAEPQWAEDSLTLITPDILPFNRELYAVTIESGYVEGDTIRYRTIYGMEFIAKGIRRTIKDFQFYRIYGKDGKPKLAENEAELLGEPVQVEYRKKRNHNKKKEETV